MHSCKVSTRDLTDGSMQAAQRTYAHDCHMQFRHFEHDKHIVAVCKAVARSRVIHFQVSQRTEIEKQSVILLCGKMPHCVVHFS